MGVIYRLCVQADFFLPPRHLATPFWETWLYVRCRPSRETNANGSLAPPLLRAALCICRVIPYHQVEDLFWSDDYVDVWLCQLAHFVRTVKLESLHLKVYEFGSQINSTYTDTSMITDEFLEDLAYGPFRNFSVGTGGGGGSGGRRGDPSTLRRLWLGATSRGPSITAGMAAIGANVPHLEELVVDQLKITDEGWRRFATARADDAAKASSRLRRIRILTNGSATVPSAATRGPLEDTVSESLTLFLEERCRSTAGTGTAAGGGGGGGGGGSGSNVSGGSPYVDCEGAPIELSDQKNNPSSKTRVVERGMWGYRKGGVWWMCKK